MKKQISKILLILLTSIFITGCSLDLKSDKPIENGIIQENVQLTVFLNLMMNRISY